MVLTFYGYRRCKTCRDVEKLFRAAGLNYEFIDLIKEPPDLEILEKALQKYGVEGVVRRGKKEALDSYERLGASEFLDLLRREPERLRRPIVVSGGEVYVGKESLELLKGVGKSRGV